MEEFKEKSDEEADIDVLVKEDLGSSDQHKPDMSSLQQKLAEEEAKPAEVIDEKLAVFDDSEDERGLECPLQREVSAEEAITQQLESKSRKQSSAQE